MGVEETQQKRGKIGTQLALARLENKSYAVKAFSGLTANGFKIYLRQIIPVIRLPATQPKPIRLIKAWTEKKCGRLWGLNPGYVTSSFE